MRVYFTQRVSLQKMHINPRSSELPLRKGSQKGSETTEAWSGREEKVQNRHDTDRYYSAYTRYTRAGQAGRHLPGVREEGIYPGVYTLPCTGRHMPCPALPAWEASRTTLIRRPERPTYPREEGRRSLGHVYDSFLRKKEVSRLPPLPSSFLRDNVA